MPGRDSTDQPVVQPGLLEEPFVFELMDLVRVAQREGDVVETIGNPCPTYTQLLVTVPDTTDTSTVAATLDTCSLAVHPIGSDL